MKRWEGLSWAEGGLLAAAILVGSLLWVQGWASRILNNLDMLPYFHAAWSLLQSGSLPDHGHLLSYGAYSPPGVAFLLVPGMILIRDARLQEQAVKLVLYIGTVVCVYWIGRRTMGRRAGLVAGLIAAISQLAQQDLIETQFFVSSSLFLLVWGAQGGRKWWFAAALLDFGIGLYVHPTIAPFLLIFPVVMFLFRRSVSFRFVGLAVLALALVWLPYLLFEAPRGFVDVRSFMARQPAGAIQSGAAVAPVYCFAAMPGEEQVENGVYVAFLGRADIAKRIIYAEQTMRGGLNYQVCKVLTNTVHNFDADFFLLGNSQPLNVLLWVMAMAGMVGVALASLPLSVRLPFREARWYWVISAGLVGAAALFGLFNPDWLVHFVVPHRVASGTRLALEQLALFLPAVWLGGMAGLLLMRAWDRDDGGMKVVALAAWIPFLLLCLINEPGRPDRFMWFWPLDILALAFAVEMVARLLPGPVWIASAICAGMIILVIPGPFYSSRLTDWEANGYAGQDSGQIKTVDFLGRRARELGRSSLTVGYSLQYPVFTTEVTSDPLYRTGSWMDFLLLTRQGIRNLNQTVQGLGPADEIRVLEEPAGKLISQSSGQNPGEGFCPLARFGHYEIDGRCE